jgi:hypothetical protein
VTWFKVVTPITSVCRPLNLSSGQISLPVCLLKSQLAPAKWLSLPLHLLEWQFMIFEPSCGVMHSAISILGIAKSFFSGNFLNLMEPFNLAPLKLRKSSIFKSTTSLQSATRPFWRKNRPIVHPPLTHTKKKMSFTSFKTVLIPEIMLLNARS